MIISDVCIHFNIFPILHFYIHEHVFIWKSEIRKKGKREKRTFMIFLKFFPLKTCWLFLSWVHQYLPALSASGLASSRKPSWTYRTPRDFFSFGASQSHCEISSTFNVGGFYVPNERVSSLMAKPIYFKLFPFRHPTQQEYCTEC